MIKYVTGIGSRETPQDVLDQLYQKATELALEGYILRSGGADGCDSAFEAGFSNAGGKMEIYLPWRRFNQNNSPLYNILPEAFDMAAKIHPAWHKLSDAARKLHARNCHQILGTDLKTPSHLVVCYTPGGKVVGGTATALKLAEQYKIEIINFGITK